MVIQEVKRCFIVDDPEQSTITTYTRSPATHAIPTNINPAGIIPNSYVLVGDIFFKPNIARKVLKCINRQWNGGNDAVFTQYTGGKTTDVVVLGYTYFPNAIEGQDLIRIVVAE